MAWHQTGNKPLSKTMMAKNTDPFMHHWASRIWFPSKTSSWKFLPSNTLTNNYCLLDHMLKPLKTYFYCGRFQNNLICYHFFRGGKGYLDLKCYHLVTTQGHLQHPLGNSILEVILDKLQPQYQEKDLNRSQYIFHLQQLIPHNTNRWWHDNFVFHIQNLIFAKLWSLQNSTIYFVTPHWTFF